MYVNCKQSPVTTENVSYTQKKRLKITMLQHKILIHKTRSAVNFKCVNLSVIEVCSFIFLTFGAKV